MFDKCRIEIIEVSYGKILSRTYPKQLIDSNGTISVARVRQICGFEDIRQLDYLQGWGHPL